jgi:23S rRNA pseudouridine2605 synthase
MSRFVKNRKDASLISRQKTPKIPPNRMPVPGERILSDPGSHGTVPFPKPISHPDFMRLNRYLASAGLGSRRSVEALVLEGKVRINGQVVEDLSTRVGPQDVVKVGSRVIAPQETIHALLFKPKGFVCTASDERQRRTIFDLLPTDWPRVYHVGRLDMESEGLLLVTNDGDLALALTHPRFKLEKEYEVTLDKPFDPAHTAKLLRGFHIEGGRARMESVQIVAPEKLRVILTQGIKRQIRLMLYDCGYEVETLRRTRIGTLRIEKLRPGMWRMLSPKDLSDLKAGRAPKPRPFPRAGNPEVREKSRAHTDHPADRPTNRKRDARKPDHAEARRRGGSRTRSSGRPSTDR